MPNHQPLREIFWHYLGEVPILAVLYSLGRVQERWWLWRHRRRTND